MEKFLVQMIKEKKIMKYYILTQYHIEDSYPIGIFSSKQKAINYLILYYPDSRFIEEDGRIVIGNRYGWEIIFYITEHILDDMSMNEELIFPN